MPNLTNPEGLNSEYLINADTEGLDFVYVHIPDGLNPLPPEIQLYSYTEDGKVIFKLMRGNSIVGIIRLIKVEVCESLFYVVDKIKVIEERRGFGLWLYEYAFLTLDYPVISGNMQTKPGSSDLWAKFRKLQDEDENGNLGYEILVLNVNTCNLVKLVNPYYMSDYDIWGMDGDFLDMAKSDTTFLRDALDDGDLTLQQYKYYTKEVKNLKERKHIRLVGRRKTIQIDLASKDD